MKDRKFVFEMNEALYKASRGKQVKRPNDLFIRKMYEALYEASRE